MSDTCRRFKLSDLTADNEGPWEIDMLMFWNSSYDATRDRGALESLRMYLYDGSLTADEAINTPVKLFAPISLDPDEVPYVRGFLEYEQLVSLQKHTVHTYRVVDTTASAWRNADSAVLLAAVFGTDAVASIHLTVRTQSYNKYKEVSFGKGKRKG